MRLLKLSGMAIAILMVTAVSAFAGTVGMQFNGTGPYSYGGVSTYPYAFTVDGSPESLMCIGYNEHIVGGETWLATSMSVAQYGALIGNVQKADQLAYLYDVAYVTGGSKSAANAAAWFLNEGVPPLDSQAQALYNQAISQVYPPGAFASLEVFVPIDGTQSWVGELPQTFYGGTPTPEPGTLLMVGSGILGVAGFLRNKLLT